ncbi:MAG: ribonuclease P protein component [Patescibacteria group bacterium]|jgi:ribonuclease P protein component
MLAFRSRLTKEKDFKKINRLGRPFFSPGFRVKFLANNLKSSRFAIVISTKVSKKATQRNRTRRQLQEIIRLNQTKVKPGYDIVISVQPQVLGKSYQELEAKIFAALNKSKLLQ